MEKNSTTIEPVLAEKFINYSFIVLPSIINNTHIYIVKLMHLFIKYGVSSNSNQLTLKCSQIEFPSAQAISIGNPIFQYISI